MRPMAWFALICSIALVAAQDAQAQSKKKGKEPKLAISKCGELIFEDDFEGKELGWNIEHGEWGLHKGTLATRTEASGSENALIISRPFAESPDVILEFKLCMPLKCTIGIYPGRGGSAQSPMGYIETHRKAFSLLLVTDGVQKEVAVSPFSYQKPRWVSVVIERIGGRTALTVDSKTITHGSPAGDSIPRKEVRFRFIKPSPDLLAIDDVRVWKALPKDESDKDKKKGK